jgi:hypothetical protein
VGWVPSSVGIKVGNIVQMVVVVHGVHNVETVIRIVLSANDIKLKFEGVQGYEAYISKHVPTPQTLIAGINE